MRCCLLLAGIHYKTINQTNSQLKILWLSYLFTDDFILIFQGRDSSNMGWLTFTFSLQKKFEALFGEKLEVIRMQQQQENLKFMSHFKNGLVIKQGSRRAQKINPNWTATPEFFHIRKNGSILCRRCIEIRPDAANLNSSFCYILKIPFDPKDKSGIVYVWIGKKSDADDARVAEELVKVIKRYFIQGFNHLFSTLNYLRILLSY